MKKTFLSLVVSLFLFISSKAFAQQASGSSGGGSGRHGAGFGVGQVFLLGDFADPFSNGLGMEFFHSYDASEMFGLMTIINLSNHSNADESNKLSLRGITPNLKMNLIYFDRFSVHALAGIGVYFINEKLGVREGSVTTMGFNFGTGFDLTLSDHFRFGTQLKFHSIFEAKDTSLSPPMTIGGTYMGLFLNLTYLF